MTPLAMLELFTEVNMRKISESIHSETGFMLYEYENEDGTTTEIIETNDGEEIEFKLFMQTFSRYV